MFLRRLPVALFFLLIIAYISISYSLSNQVLFPVSNLEKTKKTISEEWNTTFEKLIADMPAYDTFKVQGADEISLAGKYFAASDSSQCAIIFVHGWGELWAGMLKYVPLVEDCGCDYVFYDHRVHGTSGGHYATGSIKESKDLWKVTEWVMEKKGFAPSQIVWLGSSWGAATSLMAGATKENIGLIIADAPFEDWYTAIFERGIKDYGSGVKLLSWGVMKAVNLRAQVNYINASPINATSNIEEPVFLFHSKADSATDYQQSVHIAEQLNTHSEFYLTDFGNDHVMDVINNTEDIKRQLHAFIKKEAPYFLNQKDDTPEPQTSAK